MPPNNKLGRPPRTPKPVRSRSQSLVLSVGLTACELSGNRPNERPPGGGLTAHWSGDPGAGLLVKAPPSLAPGSPLNSHAVRPYLR